MLSAVILSAGESRRMGRPKALLEYRGKFFIEAVRSALAVAGVDSVIAVLGRHSEEIRKAWKPEGVVFTVNARPEEGQLSSFRIGLEAAPKNAEAFMVCLVDQPAIAPWTYKDIIAFWSAHKDCIVIPCCRRPAAQSPVANHQSQDTSRQSQVIIDSILTPLPSALSFKRGHPVIIPAIYRRLCFEGPLEAGLHWVTHHPSVKVADLEVEDAGIIFDIDTPEDYRKHKAD
ncbi:MAG: nucleotidyltransferase family protein [Elusimicrobia bacterium]|nr:nucleotidyltransferase family protein [Elusimicrobiota bacterium]